jgi:hypothetical protein
MGKPISQKRIWFLNSITLIVSLAISLLTAELILHVRDYYAVQVGSQKQDWPAEFYATRHHRLIPNARYRHKELEYDYIWSNNSLGMRDRERSPHKDPRSFRIFFLGDSFVQGYGVPQEKTMVALLEASLNKPEREKTIEVLNGGVYGYSPFLEYLYLKEVLPLIDPDLVIVAFFLGNDVGDDYFYTHQAHVSKVDGSVFFEDHKMSWSYLFEVLDSTSNTSALVNRVKSPNEIEDERHLSDLRHYVKSELLKLHLVRMLKKVRDQMHLQREYRERHEREAQLILNRKDDIRINLGLVNYPVLDRTRRLEYWKLSRGYLADIHHLCNMHGIPMVMVVIPVLDAKANQFKEPYEVLDEIARDLSIPVIKLLPEFQKWPLESLEYEIDGHWNPEGNLLAATIMDRELRKLNLLPRRKAP